MATSNVDDTQTVKRRRLSTINYALCLKCQKVGGQLVKEPELKSYERFLDCTKQRATYGDIDYVAVDAMLQNISADDLVQNKATWHTDCYKSTTNKTYMQRLSIRYEKSLSTGSVPSLPSKGRPAGPSLANISSLDQTTPDTNVHYRRSAATVYNKQSCFFCGDNDKTGLHEIRSLNAGKQLRQAVESSENMQWKVQLSSVLDPNDAHAYDIKYHLYCWVKHVQRGVPEEEHKDTSSSKATTDNVHTNSRQLSAEIEFYSLLSCLIKSGSVVSMSDAQETYNAILRMHNAADYRVTRKQLKTMISSHVPDVEFCRPSRLNEPQLMCSKSTKNAAVSGLTDTQQLTKDVKSIFDCGKMIRQTILEAQQNDPWKFEGSLQTEHDAPQLLKTLLRWIIAGPVQTLMNKDREEHVNRSVSSIAQTVMYAVKSDRQVKYQPKNETNSFRHKHENPQVLGLALSIHHTTRSKAEVNLLHSFGYCVDYQRILRVETQIAQEVLKQMEATNGTYVPPSLQKGRFIFFAIDNSDFNEDTPDGKNTLHATATAVFQQTHADDSPTDDLVLTSSITSDRSLSDSSQYSVDLQPCSMKGNPKPKVTVRYESFKPLQHTTVLAKYKIVDTAWLVMKTSTRSDTGDASPNVAPTWSAYNSICCTESKPLTTVNPLPLLAAPAHEWQTMMTVLKQAQHINAEIVGPDRKTVITLDMALYEKARRLELLHPDYKDKYIFRIGEFHTVLCALRAIGSSIENSGIDDAWIAAEMYGPTTTRQIIEGKHMKRAVNAHLSTLLALFGLYQRELVKKHPELESCEQEIQSFIEESTTEMKDIHRKHSKLLDSMDKNQVLVKMDDFDIGQRAPFKFARSYMDAVMALLSFIRATRLGLWDLHLASLEKLCIIFFARDRLNYAKMVPGYIAQMYSLQTSDPDIWDEFQKGNFSVNKNAIPFCSIGVDHAIEHVNRMMKVKGGLSGITLKPAALARFFLVAPVMHRLSEQVQQMTKATTRQQGKHHELSPAITKRQTKQVDNLQRIIEECNPFTQENDTLVNIVTQEVMPEKVQIDILRSDEAGKRCYEEFVAQRVVGPTSPWEKMKKLNLLTWKSASKTTKIKLDSHVVELKENRALFARLLIIARSRPDVDLQVAIGMYEFSCIPRSLFASDGSLLACLDKSKLMAILEAPTRHDNEPLSFNANSEVITDHDDDHDIVTKTLIIDGMAVVQELSLLSVKTCEEFAQDFVRTIEHRSAKYDNVHLVFDRYNTEQSLKQMTRKHRYGKDGEACHFDVNDATQIKVPLKKFLSSNKTKDKLTVYLAKKTLAHFEHSVQVLVTATKNGAESNHCDVSHLSSNHEEADTLLIFHALHASSRGHIVHIMSPDTDVFVLATRRQGELGDEACMIIGTGDKRRIVPLKPIHDVIGEDVAECLPGFHAFTGSDTTGRFSGKGKLKCWNALKASRQTVIQAFSQLGKTDLPSEATYDGLEEFVCRLYSPRSSMVNVAMLRWQLFKKCQAEAEKLPPTRATLKHHILRAHYQSMIWANDSIGNPDLPSPLDYGWKLDGSLYKAITSDLPPAPSAVVELVKCGCTSSKCSSSLCSCKKHDMSCTELCMCEADEDRCDNKCDVQVSSDDESDGHQSDGELE